MKRTAKTAALLLIIPALFLSSCARIPPPKQSSKLIQHYFKKYAKKYHDTTYARSGGIKEVEVTSQQEIHKYLVAVEAFITLKDSSVQRIRATLDKGPFGWHFISWENDTGI
ncbi:MAG: hypothetical protein V2A66_05960 [Pseudomonadota bacterium]